MRKVIHHLPFAHSHIRLFSKEGYIDPIKIHPVSIMIVFVLTACGNGQTLNATPVSTPPAVLITLAANPEPTSTTAPTVRPPTQGEKMNEQQIKSRYEAGERDFSGLDLSGFDFNGARLSQVDFSGANLSDADLSTADLSGANLSNANLNQANLSGAILKESNLSNADFTEADLSWSNLSNANLSNANLNGANMEMAIIIRTRFKNTTMPDGSKK